MYVIIIFGQAFSIKFADEKVQLSLIKKNSGEWFRSIDLWVMSPARYHCATPLIALYPFILITRMHCLIPSNQSITVFRADHHW